MWLEYSRYRYADKIIQTLTERGVDFKGIDILDYGCGVGDYGFALGRLGSGIWFYDFPIVLAFIQWRLRQEKPEIEGYIVVAEENKKWLENFDLVIFGEVLEHLDDPYKVIEDFVNAETNYIFTSSYPFRSDDPNDDYWKKSGHDEKSRLQQFSIRELLFKYYERVQYNGEASLWIRK